MDSTLTKITDFAFDLTYADLPAAAVHECKRRIVDSFACALGAFDAQPSRIARALAAKLTSRTPARIIGTLEPTSPELAAFTNGVMVRYLDLNDATGSGGGHPSDALSALFAAGEANRTDGKTLILAMAILYELYLGFYAGVRVRNKGWDHVVYTVLGAAAAVAKIMKLDRAKTANALSLALTPNMAMDVVRRGELSMWKGCAGPNAARNAVFAAELAAEGMTAPQAVFEGDNGVWNAVGQFAWPAFAGNDRAFRVGDTQMKMYPCEYHAQSPIEVALAIRSQIDPDEIEAIIVRTYWFGWSEAGSEPAKWNPTTRETADHSIPYIVCAALIDGKIDGGSFADARIADPYLRALIQKVQVIHDTELDKLHPASNPCRLEITLKGGDKKSASVDYAKGHVKNAASDAEIEKKLMTFNGGLIAQDRLERLLDLCWRLDEVQDVRDVISTLQI